MKHGFVRSLALLLLLGLWATGHVLAATPGPALLKAKKDAEAKGFLFETSYDEIVAKAKKEGKVRVLSSFDPNTFKPMIESFKKKYPFIDVEIQEITGTEAAQRFLLELKAGTVREWDIVHATEDFYNEYAAHAKKFDILGMAEQGVLKINPKMVDPENRTMIALGTGACTLAYNNKRLSPDKVPSKWEDLLKPEFRGRKFLVDVRPHCMAALTAGMGEEWVMNYARKIKEQQPVFVRGNTRALTAIIAGEYVLHQMTNYHSCVRAAEKDLTKSLVCQLVEPIPARIQEVEQVVSTAPRPHAALLFLEHEASPEGQKVVDEFEPLKSHVYADGEIAKLARGKKVSLNDFKTYHGTPKWMKMVLEAYGFPKPEIR